MISTRNKDIIRHQLRYFSEASDKKKSIDFKWATEINSRSLKLLIKRLFFVVPSKWPPYHFQLKETCLCSSEIGTFIQAVGCEKERTSFCFAPYSCTCTVSESLGKKRGARIPLIIWHFTYSYTFTVVQFSPLIHRILYFRAYVQLGSYSYSLLCSGFVLSGARSKPKKRVSG